MCCRLIFALWSFPHGSIAGAVPVDFEREVDLKVIQNGDFNEPKLLAECLRTNVKVQDVTVIITRVLCQVGLESTEKAVSCSDSSALKRTVVQLVPVWDIDEGWQAWSTRQASM